MDLQKEVVSQMQQFQHPLLPLVHERGEQFFSYKDATKNKVADMKHWYRQKPRKAYLHDGHGNSWEELARVDMTIFCSKQIYAV